jgi:hypothetical protein
MSVMLQLRCAALSMTDGACGPASKCGLNPKPGRLSVRPRYLRNIIKIPPWLHLNNTRNSTAWSGR